jgi:hypothetical protein
VVGRNTYALIGHTARRAKFPELPRGERLPVLTDCEADIRADYLDGALIMKAWPLPSCKTASAEYEKCD